MSSEAMLLQAAFKMEPALAAAPYDGRRHPRLAALDSGERDESPSELLKAASRKFAAPNLASGLPLPDTGDVEPIQFWNKHRCLGAEPRRDFRDMLIMVRIALFKDTRCICSCHTSTFPRARIAQVYFIP
jgi:hypothetical protein